MHARRCPSRPPWCSLAAALVPLGVLTAGCAPPQVGPVPNAMGDRDQQDHGHDDHGHDDHAHPVTLADGVAELRTTVSKLEETLAADNRDAADEAVHAIGHLLEDLRGLVDGATLASEGRAAATAALDELDECFGAIDEAFHAGDTAADSPAKVHEGVAERIAAALRKLEELP